MGLWVVDHEQAQGVPRREAGVVRRSDDATGRVSAVTDGRRLVGKERAMIREALSGSFELPVYFDYPATFIWALSGAVLAARLRMDPTGVALIALVTAAGGGLLRDGLFLQVGPPALIRTPVYIILIAGGRNRHPRRCARAPLSSLR